MTMNIQWPNEPYRGLRFYQPADFPIFAGRSRDVVECAKALNEAEVVLLHGRTGCGKSSFLRAGLKPYFERRRSVIGFGSDVVGEFDANDPSDGILVARSGERPLQRLAELVFTLVEDLSENKMSLGVTFGDPREALLNREDIESFVNEVGVDASLMMDSLEALADCVSGTPILVIDQAEEVFTLSPHGGAQRNFDLRGVSASEQSGQTVLLAHEYFRFLSNVSRERLGVKIVVSMRTEYKGQFDDEIAHHGNPGNIVGYFLPDLDREGIIEAIEMPTKPAPKEWGIESGFEHYGFEYTAGFPEYVADVLLNSRPRGGVLPVLQVICSRLYHTSKHSVGDKNWKITEVDFKKLGNVEDQVDYFLRESFEKILLELGVEAADLSPFIDRWYELLKNLVSVEADGRVTTQKLMSARLDEAAKRTGAPHYERVRDALATDGVGVLRRDAALRGEEWSLGHDSIGLAIQKWWTTFGAVNVSRRTSISARHSRELLHFSGKDLFDDERPEKIELIVPDTLVWSHQIPFYAMKKGFFERLGFDMTTPDSLNAAKTDTSYMKLSDQLGKENKDFLKRTVAPIERSNFPRLEQSSMWSDFAITNLYTGYALIGPVIDSVVPDFGLGGATGRDGYDMESGEMIENIRRLLKTIARPKDHAKWTIYCYNDTAKRFLELLVRLAGCEKQLQNIEIKILENELLSASDPLASIILNTPNSMIITTAVGRALCERSGFTTYADTQRVSYIIDDMYRDDPEKLKQAYSEYRSAISHITWQIGVKKDDWNKPPNRANILRLASVAFCTVDQIIQNPDDYVRFIYDRFTKDMEKSDVRIDRESVRATIERSYIFMNFENQARFFFDRNSEFGYWAEEREGGKIGDSVVRDIYSELINLRKQTFDSYDELNKDIISLREVKTDLNSVDAMRIAEDLKEKAWRHYRIFNFYDSARFMTKAKQALQDIT